MDPDDRVVQSVRSPVVVGLTSTVGPEELSQRGRRIPTTSFSLEHFPHCEPFAPLGRWGDERSPSDDDLVQIMLVAGGVRNGPAKMVGATGFEPATFRSPSRRELVATVGRPLGAYPPFPASCPCSGDHSRPAPPLTDPSVRDSRTRFLTQDSPDRPTHDRCAAEATDAGGAAVGIGPS